LHKINMAVRSLAAHNNCLKFCLAFSAASRF
jgi:hypothetical protein